MMGPIKTIPKNWNTWTKIEIKGPLTLQQLIDQVKKEYKFNVSSVVCQNQQIWCSFMNNFNDRLEMQMD